MFNLFGSKKSSKEEEVFVPLTSPETNDEEENIVLEDVVVPEQTQECQHLKVLEGICLACDAVVNSSTESIQWSLKFPWAEYSVEKSLWIGRIKPANEEIIFNLEENFKNISRNHAEISIINTQLYIRDLDSTNGTFVDGKRISPLVQVQLEANSSLKLANSLEIVILNKG